MDRHDPAPAQEPLDAEPRFGRTLAPSQAHALVLPGVAIPKQITRREPLVVAAATLFTCGVYAVPWLYRTSIDANQARVGGPRRPLVHALLALCTFMIWTEVFLIGLAADVRKLPGRGANARDGGGHGKSMEIATLLPWVAALAIVVPPLVVVTLALGQAMLNAVAEEALDDHRADPA